MKDAVAIVEHGKGQMHLGTGSFSFVYNKERITQILMFGKHVDTWFSTDPLKRKSL